MGRKKFNAGLQWSSKSRERGDKDKDTPIPLNGLVKVAKFPIV
jgi:hypothetical protein